MEKEPVGLPPPYPTSQPDSRRSSITVNDVTVGSGVEKVEDIEIAKSVSPPVSDEHGVDVPPTVKNSPLEEEEFPEGSRGWLVVLGAFIYAAVVLGWPYDAQSSGYSPKHGEPYRDSAAIAMRGFNVVRHATGHNVYGIYQREVGRSITRRGLQFLTSIASSGYKPFIAVGSVIAVIGLLTAAFSTQLWHFFITQGGGVTSIIVRALLTRLGLRKTLLVYAGINAVLLPAAFFLLKSRGPARHIVKIQWVDRNAFGDLVFWSLALCMLFTDFGYLPPVVFLTTYTNDKIPNISAQRSVAPTAVMNFSSAIGRTVVGLTADRIGVTNAFIGSIFLSAIAQLVVWNLAESYAAIMASLKLTLRLQSLLAPVTAQLFGTSKLATLTGLFMMFNLPGHLAGPPLAGAILSATNRNWHAAVSYAGAVQVVGVCAFLYVVAELVG
ncbi:hypothetical protein FRC05_007616 [Tulasnella sp. 425]|nr:hypothetical protein FRC05_007616 [Tulasnella sp. 425]